MSMRWELEEGKTHSQHNIIDILKSLKPSSSSKSSSKNRNQKTKISQDKKKTRTRTRIFDIDNMTLPFSDIGTVKVSRERKKKRECAMRVSQEQKQKHHRLDKKETKETKRLTSNDEDSSFSETRGDAQVRSSKL